MMETKTAAEKIVAAGGSQRPPVIAVRANDIAFTGLLRGIHASGLESISVVYTWPGSGPWYCESSSHFKNVFHIDNPVDDETMAARQLEALGKALWQRYKKRALVLPSSDTVQLLFFRHEEMLSPWFDLMGDGNYNSYRSEITNKGSFFQILQQIHPELCPTTYWCKTKDDIEDIVKKVDFPAVIKPAVKDYGQSFYRYNDGSKAISLQDNSQLEAKLTELIERGFELVVQRRVEFDTVLDEVPFYIYVDGQHRVKMAASGVKEFIQPHPFGTATVLRLIAKNELIELAQKVANAIEWRGTLMIEFIFNKAEQCWQIIEVNTRPWLFHDFYRRFGMDFVPTAVKDHAGLLDTDFDNNDVKVPDQKIVDALKPIHVDLRTIAADLCHQNLTPAENLANLKRHITQYSSTISLAAGSKEDPAPALALFSDLAAMYPLNEPDLKSVFLDSLEGDLDTTKLLPMT